MLGRLVTHWAAIVGPDLADKAQPVKLRYRKIPGGKPEASLDISSTTAEATLLHYRKDLILERINQIFGERLITALRFVPQAANEPASRRKIASRRPIPAEKQQELSNILDKIDDPELKERLETLGKSILQEH